MGLYELLTSPTGNPYYAQNSAFINPNSFSTAEFFGQRDIPWPSNDTQPYIKIPLPDVVSKNTPTVSNNNNGIFNFNPTQGFTGADTSNSQDGAYISRIRYNAKSWGPDFLTRGNLYGLIRTGDDIVRLTKYFFDFTRIGNKGGDVSGLFFTLKQNLLSLAGDETIYTPFSTLAQAAISLTGASVKKQGLGAGIETGAFSSFAGINNPLEIPEDFRSGSVARILTKVSSSAAPSKNPKITYLSTSPDYTKFNIEQRTNFRSGGTRGNILNYQTGKSTTTGQPFGPTDVINAIPIYQSAQPTNNSIATDLIDFRIAIIDNQTIGENPLKNLYLHFRAYLKGFTDNYSTEWKSIEYMGRAEKFYKYGGFKRGIDMSFKLAASSKEELMPMYKKLNFLASSLAPDYSENGYMRANIAKITVGNYLYEQPGVIESLNVSIPDDSPWEINLGLNGEPMENMRQLPHMVEVKLKFNPIHEFRPEIMKLSNLKDAENFKPDNILNQDPSYGQQRFISLKNQTQGTEGSYDKISDQ